MSTERKTTGKKITAGEAVKLLGINRRRLSRLFNSGDLSYETDPFDKRKKWVSLDKITEIKDKVSELQKTCLKATDVVRELKTTRFVISRMFQTGDLSYVEDPLDKRIRWVRREDVETIKSKRLS